MDTYPANNYQIRYSNTQQITGARAAFLVYMHLYGGKKKWLVLPAMVGGASLLADGIITPPISVTSAIEGLQQLPFFGGVGTHTIIAIVIGILSALFFSNNSVLLQ